MVIKRKKLKHLLQNVQSKSFEIWCVGSSSEPLQTYSNYLHGVKIGMAEEVTGFSVVKKKIRQS